MQSTCQFTIRAHQEMRYQNVTWHNLICLLTYAYRNHWTINRTTHPLPEHSSNAYLLHIMDVGLRKAPYVSLRIIMHFPCFYYLVCSLPIHKICALCGIFSAISLLLTTKNSDDLEIRVPRVNVIESYTSEFLTCHFLLVINCTRGRILYRLWDIAFDRSTIAIFCYPSCV